MSDFDSLTLALEEWFDRPLDDLPEALRLRAEQELRPHRWEDLSPEHRRSVALQLDYQHDPATEWNRECWWDFFHRMSALEAELAREGASDRVSLDELLDGSGRLKVIRDNIRRMKARERHAKANYYPRRRVPVRDLAPGKYIAYPKALHHLRERLGSTPEELAAWVWLGSDTGGLTAYLNVNELDPPPRFNFGELPFFGTAGEEDADYVAPLMGCWFSSDDVANFQPADRFITGKALIGRWNAIPGLKVEPFIRAKIQESRLMDLHPIYGGTQAGGSNANHLPPTTEGLFRLADVEEIEAEDFANDLAPSDAASPAMLTEEGEAASISSALAAVLDVGSSTLSFPIVAAGLPSDHAMEKLGGLDQELTSTDEARIVSDETTTHATAIGELTVGSPAWRKENARTAANSKHDRPGGSRDKRRQICEAWASGKYSSRDTCAEQECAALGISYSTARRALNNTPEPSRG